MRSLISKGVNVNYCDPVFAERHAQLFEDLKRTENRKQRFYFLKNEVRSQPYGSLHSIESFPVELDIEECKDWVCKGKRPRISIDDDGKQWLDSSKLIEEPLHAVIVFCNHSRFQDQHIYNSILESTADGVENFLPLVIDTRNVIAGLDIEDRHHKLFVLGRC